MIPMMRPALGDAEVQAVDKVIRSGWVTQGPMVRRFEQLFAEYVGAPFAVATTNCTSALHLALLAAGVRAGDVVITVSHTFIASANAIRLCGAQPLFVDISLKDFNIDPESLLNTLATQCKERSGEFFYEDAQGNSRRVSALLVVHQMGIPCDLSSMLDISRRYRLPLVEDAACAVGSSVSLNGQAYERIGKPHGNFACFSFHPRKNLTTGDGGMLTLKCEETYKRLLRIRQHGMEVSDLDRHESDEVIFERYTEAGFNYRMTDIQAAIGIEQLKKSDQLIQARYDIAERYTALLSDLDWIETWSGGRTARTNWQSFPIRLKDPSIFSQLDFMKELLKQGVQTRRGIMNIHQETPYLAHATQLPQSELARDSVVLLPIFPGLENREIDYISNVIHQIKTKRSLRV